MTESSLIGFSRGSARDATFNATNPATGEMSDRSFCHASGEDVAKACELASDASLGMASLSGAQKGSFLRDLADRIDGLVDQLVVTMTEETGLPEPRVRGETGRTTFQLRMFADLVESGNWVDARIDRAQPDRQPLPKPDLRSMLRPVGPVVVFCASNFPLAFSVAGGDSVSAWAAGCPVIVKAHHAHPGTALLVGNAVVDSVRASGLPEGAFSLIFGDGRTVGQALVSHPAIKAVGFTGSRAGGRALFDLASQRDEPIPVYAEMSSVNPIFILPGLGLALIVSQWPPLRSPVDLRAVALCMLLATTLAWKTRAMTLIWQDPISLNSHILRYEPHNAKIHNNLASALAGTGRIQSAIRHYQRAIEIDDVYPHTHHNLGKAYRELGQIEKAAQEYSRALSFDPDFHSSLVELGWLEIQAGKADLAETYFRRALKTYPYASRAYLGLAQIRFNRGRKKEAEAILLEGLERVDSPALREALLKVRR